MQLDYFEMHGTGNRILVVDQRANNLPPPDLATIKQLGRGIIGPGFDQMMWVTTAVEPDHAARYRVFNTDGSEVEQCGNGVRCVARVLARESQLNQYFMIESPAGVVEARMLDNGLISINMGPPVFAPACIPFLADDEALSYALEADGQTFDVAAISMGNPHCVLQVPDVTTAPVGRIGPLIEHHERFPERTNVGFMQIVDNTTIELRVHERGVGETRACGTGACAAVVAGQRRGLLGPEVTVRLPGGEVMVSWRGGHDPVWLTGNAELIAEGTVEI